jgi:hypothetical protein
MYTLQNNICPLQNIMIPKAQHGKSLTLKPGIASRIVIAAMLAAVRFNNQLVFHADKIDDKRPYRFLAFKFQIQKTVSAKMIPKPLFGFGLVGTQIFGMIEFTHCPLPNPSPNGRGAFFILFAHGSSSLNMSSV